mmetsp:Transcript_34783/g.86519  ORF Transcript_34783/g.86519 Transcript_34783/m.86519 type:complete len:201 (-) Transcript_34783:95-697(-)
MQWPCTLHRPGCCGWKATGLEDIGAHCAAAGRRTLLRVRRPCLCHRAERLIRVSVSAASLASQRLTTIAVIFARLRNCCSEEVYVIVTFEDTQLRGRSNSTSQCDVRHHAASMCWRSRSDCVTPSWRRCLPWRFGIWCRLQPSHTMKSAPHLQAHTQCSSEPFYENSSKTLLGILPLRLLRASSLKSREPQRAGARLPYL